MKGLRDVVAQIKSVGFTAAFFNFFQGRATTFAIYFTFLGTYLALRGKLDANYALFVTAIQGLVFAHSCKEDWVQIKKLQAVSTVSANANQVPPTS